LFDKGPRLQTWPITAVTFDKKSGLFWLQFCTKNKNITLGGFSRKQEQFKAFTQLTEGHDAW
jgi:hypothetical protein